MNPLILAAAGAGVCFAFYSIFGRFGIPRNIHMLHLAAVIGIFGGACLLPGALRDIDAAGGGLPVFVVILGLVNGAVRYFGTLLWNKALVMGPLTPLACATNLGFIMTIPFVWIVHGQASSALHWGAVALAMVSVFLAAKANAVNRPEAAAESRKAGIAYLLILFGIWIFGGLGNVIIKEVDVAHFSDSSSYLDAYGNLFWVCEYFSLGILSTIDRLMARSRPGQPVVVVLLGIGTVVTALTGMELLRLAIPLHPAIYFSTSNVTSIVFSVLVGTLIFKEKRIVWWYLTVIASVSVVLIANAGI